MYNNSISNLSEKQEVKLEKTELELNSSEYVEVSKQGENFAEVSWSALSSKQTIKKLSKTEYMVLSTGEVKEYKQTEVKQSDSLRKTFRRLTGLIRNNYKAHGSNQLFLTLTYAENMQDPKTLYKDFDKFIKRLRYKYSKHKLDYIAVAEPQGRGAWHMHILLKSNLPVLYIENSELEKIWGQGYTDAKRLRSDDVGTYYVAYFTDVIEESKVTDGADMSSARKKGARLGMYPKGFKFFRASRGIVEPVVVSMRWGEVVKEYGEPSYKQAFDLKEGVRVINTFLRASFKRRGKLIA